jgi:membrane fusion protein
LGCVCVFALRLRVRLRGGASISDDFTEAAPLFRPEAFRSAAHALEGEVIVTAHRRSSIATVAIVCLVGLGALVLAFSKVPRISEVSGWISTTRGVVQVDPLKAGVVEEVRVHEGQTVPAGAVLAIIRIEQVQPDIGATPEKALLRSLQEQDAQLLDSIDLTFRQAEQDTRRTTDSIAAIKAELSAVTAQMQSQRKIIEFARQNAISGETLAKEGALSRRDAALENSEWVQQSRQFSVLVQTEASLTAELATAQGELRRIPTDRDMKIAELEGTRAGIQQRIAEIEGQRSYAITAPIAGRIASLVARPGYPADERRALCEILPLGAKLAAELFVPSSAMTLVRQGQEVRLLYDAFPYSKFGSQVGHVIDVSRSAVLPAEAAAPIEIKEPVYLVHVSLDHDAINTFGRETPLQVGMTLRADIVLESRSIFEWLFEPIYAVRARA